MTEHRSGQNRERVRALLLREWDPIGIAEVEQAADEYDSYADAASAMLTRGASAASLCAYLQSMATDQMGLSDSEELRKRSRRAADMLVGLRSGFQTR